MLEAQMGQSNEVYKQWGLEDAGIGGEDQYDEIKEMVMESNPYLFGLTMVVSMLHSLFEFLALKNGKYMNEVGNTYFVWLSNFCSSFALKISQVQSK